MIYLDSAASTPCYQEINQITNRLAVECFFNPSQLYAPALAVSAEINEARKQIASAINAAPEEIYFTSGATESNNIAIFGGHKLKKSVIICGGGEHNSVHNAVLAQRERGSRVHFLALDKHGATTIDLPQFDEGISLVSVVHVSNETGAINDICALTKTVKSRAKNALIHSDGVQALGKIDVDVKKLGVDLYSISAHKIHAPKGMGALYVRSGVKINALTHGGGHEKGLRPGTENVGGIVGFGYAVERRLRERDLVKVERLRSVFVSMLEGVGDVRINSGAGCIPHIVSASIGGVRGEVLLNLLSERGVYIANGSACSARHSGNRVLEAMGVPDRLIAGSVRISFDEYTDEGDAARAAGIIANSIGELRGRG